MKRGPILPLPLVLIALHAAHVTGQEEIPLTGLECVAADGFTVVKAKEIPDTTLNVYFRAEAETEWYSVSMIPVAAAVGEARTVEALLPKPLPEAVRVVYKIAEMEPTSPEDGKSVAVIKGGCPGVEHRSTLSEDQVITVRVSAGDVPLPPKFSTEGLVAYKRGSGRLIAIIAGAGAAAGIGALATGSSEPSTGGGGGPDSLPPAACPFQTAPESIFKRDEVTFSADCGAQNDIVSYEWSFGDESTPTHGDRRESHRYDDKGTYRVTLTVRDSQNRQSPSTMRTIVVKTRPEARFDVDQGSAVGTCGGGCWIINANASLRFDGSESRGDEEVPSREGIKRWDWTFGGGRPKEGRVVETFFPSPGVFVVTLTVTNEFDEMDSLDATIVVRAGTPSSLTSPPPSLSDSGAARRQQIQMSSQLQGDGRLVGHVMFNRKTSESVDNQSRRALLFAGQAGKNAVEARLLTEPTGDGLWRFEFAGTVRPVPGSIDVESGQVVARDGASIVFRLTGAATAGLRFSFELPPE